MQRALKLDKRYKLDSSNRLILKRGERTVFPTGRFAIDKENRLLYRMNEPYPWRKLHNLPSRIVFIGKWKLNQDYDLELALSKTQGRFRNEILIIKGEIISVDKDILAFEVKSLDAQGLLHIQILKLTGFWQADEYNRLRFAVNKKAAPDILTLEGSWQINNNQQITYTYEKTGLKKKARITNTLTFEGFWQINHENKLTYILAKSSKSLFDFRVQIETPDMYSRRGEIKYRIGIGLKKESALKFKIISLYGTWKLDKNLGISFLIDYGDGKVRSIEFGADIDLSGNDKLIFYLTNKRRDPLGFSVTFSHKFLKHSNALYFLRLKKIRDESGIEAGMQIPF